jgi:hypothetical protein
MLGVKRVWQHLSGQEGGLAPDALAEFNRTSGRKPTFPT